MLKPSLRRRVHKHLQQECGYQLVSGQGTTTRRHSWYLSQVSLTLCNISGSDLCRSSQGRLLFLSLIWSLHCDFIGQSWGDNLYKGKVLVLPLPAETHCTVALIMQGKSTSVNTLCQVKVEIRSHCIKQDSIAYGLSIEKSAIFMACLPAFVTRRRDTALFTEEHAEIFLWLREKTLDQQQLVE